MEKSIVLLHSDFDKRLVLEGAEYGLDTLYLHVNPFAASVEEFFEFKSKNEKTIDELEKGGVNVVYCFHALNRLLPRALFKNEPALFAVNGSGLRDAAYNCCPSNSRALEIIKDEAFKVAEFLKQRGHRYHLWTDDDLGGDVRCLCSECKSLTTTEQNLKIYSAVFDGLKKYDKEAQTSFLIYGEENCDIRLPDGLFAEFAPFRREHDKPVTVGARNAFFADKLKRLVELNGAERVAVLEYFLSYDFVGFLKNGDRVKRDISFYREQNIESLTTFVVFNGATDDEKASGIKKYLKTLQE